MSLSFCRVWESLEFASLGIASWGGGRVVPSLGKRLLDFSLPTRTDTMDLPFKEGEFWRKRGSHRSHSHAHTGALFCSLAHTSTPCLRLLALSHCPLDAIRHQSPHGHLHTSSPAGLQVGTQGSPSTLVVMPSLFTTWKVTLWPLHSLLWAFYLM